MIVQVNDNQPTLHQQAQEISATTAPLGSACRHDRGRNRDESRLVTVSDPADTFAGTDWHSHVAAVIRVKRDVDTRNSKTGLLSHSCETAYYVANAPLTASRDVTMAEVRSRIRSNPAVFARARSFAFNILKANQTSTLSQDRYRACLAGVDNLLKRIGVAWR